MLHFVRSLGSLQNVILKSSEAQDPQIPFLESCLLDLVRHGVCQETGLLQD